MGMLSNFLLQRQVKKIVDSTPNPIKENIPKERTSEEISEKELLNELINRQDVTNWHLSRIYDRVDKIWIVTKLCLILGIASAVIYVLAYNMS